MSDKLLGLFGGTFDPIHFGHLHVAEQILKRTPLKNIQFVPNGSPPHRQAMASAKDRLHMLELAVKPYPNFSINEIEIGQNTACYTIDTLMEIKKTHPQQILYWIIGADIFPQLTNWHRWTEILEHCHLLVISRPNFSFEYLQQCAINMEVADRVTQEFPLTSHGHIFFLEIPLSPISSTKIRTLLQTNPNQAKLYLPDAIFEYVLQNGIYNSIPEISSGLE